jgi:peptide/nickel transport system substrate-binding protein
MKKFLREMNLVVGVVLLVFTLLLTSCAAPATLSPTTASPSSSSPPASSPTPTPSSTAAVTHPSIIRHTDTFPANIDPAIGTDGVAGRCQVNMYDTLVFPSNSGELKPWVATKWTTSDDGLVWTFTLQQGIKFHSGNELTADDVVFSMNRVIAIGEGWGYIFRPLIQDAKAIDKSTVQFTLKHTFGPFIDSLVRLYVVDSKLVTSNIQKPGKYGDMGDYGVTWMQTHDAGSGPYMLQEIKRGEHVLMVKFPGFWNGWDPNAPQACEEINIMDPSTLKAEMKSRNLELSDYAQPWETYQA